MCRCSALTCATAAAAALNPPSQLLGSTRVA
jgi:hypothetical protein